MILLLRIVFFLSMIIAAFYGAWLLAGALCVGSATTGALITLKGELEK